jgi:putative membrane protein
MEHQHLEHGTALSDWILMWLILSVGIFYFFGLTRLILKGKEWSIWRSLSFFFGTVLIAGAFYPELMVLAHHDIKIHMIQHILIGMVGPIFLVLGAPVTLALKAFRPAVSRKIMSVLRTRLFQVLSHPFLALILNIGGMYVLYLTPVYMESLTNPLLHYLVHIHFILAGFLFSWSIIGLDPVPNKPSFRIRLVSMFLAISFHGILSKYMYAYDLPLGSLFSKNQIQEASKIMYYWGDFSELILLVGLFYFWYKEKRKDSARKSLTV